jgi:hypothetical protein
MADAPPETGPNLRLFLDATILIKAAGHPRLPYEVVQLAIRQEARLVLSELVIKSARRHVARLYPNQGAAS